MYINICKLGAVSENGDHQIEERSFIRREDQGELHRGLQFYCSGRHGVLLLLC